MGDCHPDRLPPRHGGVVNDLPGVIDVARARAAEHEVVADRCRFRTSNFHDIEIEPARYDLVVLSHVCRTEGVAGARHLISRAFDALEPEGRLLLTDYFPDTGRKLNPHAVLMGTTMMAGTEKGFTFTHRSFSQWPTAAGFGRCDWSSRSASSRRSSPPSRAPSRVERAARKGPCEGQTHGRDRSAHSWLVRGDDEREPGRHSPWCGRGTRQRDRGRRQSERPR